MSVKSFVRSVVRKAGYDLVSLSRPGPEAFQYDISEEERAVYMAVRPYTQTSLERVVALCRAVRYVVGHDVPGDFVECGVARGGSVLAMAMVLERMGVTDRRLHLFDTFAGSYLPPGEHDGAYAKEEYAAQQSGTIDKRRIDKDLRRVDSVRETLTTSRYPAQNLVFVVGRVEDTLPAHAPETVALLRLDTDYYEPTRHELTHLYPRLSPKGILIIDDYGCPAWPGSSKATDEYFAGKGPFLARIDADARIAVKV